MWVWCGWVGVMESSVERHERLAARGGWFFFFFFFWGGPRATPAHVNETQPCAFPPPAFPASPPLHPPPPPPPKEEKTRRHDPPPPQPREGERKKETNKGKATRTERVTVYFLLCLRFTLVSPIVLL